MKNQKIELNEKLSPLQKEYRNYFRAMLKVYQVTTPAKLDEEGKKAFFNDIRKHWKKGQGQKEGWKKKVKVSESINKFTKSLFDSSKNIKQAVNESTERELRIINKLANIINNKSQKLNRRELNKVINTLKSLNENLKFYI